jgi:hypothetical protein
VQHTRARPRGTTARRRQQTRLADPCLSLDQQRAAIPCDRRFDDAPERFRLAFALDQQFHNRILSPSPAAGNTGRAGTGIGTGTMPVAHRRRVTAMLAP